MMQQLLALDPARYQRHAIHGEDRVWTETNCYVDVWIELLHAWGFDPVAALPFTFALDFEGDQWTFFKFPLGDLYHLYGLDVQELAIWRPLVDHVAEQIARGRPVLVELDSWYLPDTAGTAYRREHVKSTVAAVAIDVSSRRLGYFHGRGYYELEGEDFAGAQRLVPQGPEHLPPYVEFVKRGKQEISGSELLRRSIQILRHHLRRVPEANPFEQFRARFESDLGWLTSQGLPTFHQYSFATLRQLGACCELSATYLQWLSQRVGKPLDGPVAAFGQIALGAKTLQFQLARAINRGKPLDLSGLGVMAEAWRSALGTLTDVFAGG